MVLGTLWLLGGQFRRCFPWGIHQFGVLSVLLMLGPTAGKFPQGWDVIKTTESRAIFRMDIGLYIEIILWPLFEAFCRIRGSGAFSALVFLGPAAGKSQQG